MGLFDKFKKPKWKNEDPKIRLEAIDKINDPDTLCEIAKNDSDINVRKKAVNRIYNLRNEITDYQNILVEISNETGLLEIMVDYLDKEHLTDAIKNFGQKNINEKRKNGQSVQSIVINRNDNLNNRVIKKIRDEDTLVYIIKHTSGVECRITLNRLLNINPNNEFLIKTAKGEEECCDWIELALNIENEDALNHIIKNAKDDGRYKAALINKHYQNEEILCDNIINPPSFNRKQNKLNFCLICIQKINNVELLKKIAMSNTEVSDFAENKLSNPDYKVLTDGEIKSRILRREFY